MFLSSYHFQNFRNNYYWWKWCLCNRSWSELKRQCHRGQQDFLSQFGRLRAVTTVWINRWLRNDAQSSKWLRRSGLLFSRSSVKFQGHRGHKIVNFYPNGAFSDCDSSLNSPIAMKRCTKLEVGQERCHIVFQCDLSNFPNWPFLDQFQFQFTDGYKMMHTLSRIEQVPHCSSRSSIKFQGPTEQKIADFLPPIGPFWS